jgi:hypothetical protein
MHLVQFFNKLCPLCSDESRLAGRGVAGGGYWATALLEGP